MKINVTVGELLQLARDCLRTEGCTDCALSSFCEKYDDLEKLCVVENAMPTMPTLQMVNTETVVEKIEHLPETSESIGGVTKTVDDMVDDILSAGNGKKKRQSNNKEASEIKKRVRRLLSEGVAEYGDEFIDRLYAVGEGIIEREELLGMVGGVKYPIAIWRIAEQVYNDAGY